jgi:hypothetical protein
MAEVPGHGTVPRLFLRAAGALTEMSPDGRRRIGYLAGMSCVTALLRLVIVAVFAAGLGLPAAPATAAPMPERAMAQMHAAHHAMPAKAPMPADESCRAHCLGVSVLVAPAMPAPRAARVVPVHVVALVEAAPSLWPLPEGHPPRA